MPGACPRGLQGRIHGKSRRLRGSGNRIGRRARPSRLPRADRRRAVRGLVWRSDLARRDRLGWRGGASRQRPDPRVAPPHLSRRPGRSRSQGVRTQGRSELGAGGRRRRVRRRRTAAGRRAAAGGGSPRGPRAGFTRPSHDSPARRFCRGAEQPDGLRGGGDRRHAARRDVAVDR